MGLNSGLVGQRLSARLIFPRRDLKVLANERRKQEVRLGNYTNYALERKPSLGCASVAKKSRWFICCESSKKGLFRVYVLPDAINNQNKSDKNGSRSVQEPNVGILIIN